MKAWIWCRRLVYVVRRVLLSLVDIGACSMCRKLCFWVIVNEYDHFVLQRANIVHIGCRCLYERIVVWPERSMIPALVPFMYHHCWKICFRYEDGVVIICRELCSTIYPKQTCCLNLVGNLCTWCGIQLRLLVPRMNWSSCMGSYHCSVAEVYALNINTTNMGNERWMCAWRACSLIAAWESMVLRYWNEFAVISAVFISRHIEVGLRYLGILFVMKSPGIPRRNFRSIFLKATSLVYFTV